MLLLRFRDQIAEFVNSLQLVFIRVLVRNDLLKKLPGYSVYAQLPEYKLQLLW